VVDLAVESSNVYLAAEPLSVIREPSVNSGRLRCRLRAGSSMRLVRLKPQGPGPDRGPDRPVQRKFTK